MQKFPFIPLNYHIRFCSGVDCELDVNACADYPCPLGRNCTDLSAVEESRIGRGYNCSDCPYGYEDVDNKCQGTYCVKCLNLKNTFSQIWIKSSHLFFLLNQTSTNATQHQQIHVNKFAKIQREVITVTVSLAIEKRQDYVKVSNKKS